MSRHLIALFLNLKQWEKVDKEQGKKIYPELPLKLEINLTMLFRETLGADVDFQKISASSLFNFFLTDSFLYWHIFFQSFELHSISVAST